MPQGLRISVISAAIAGILGIQAVVVFSPIVGKSLGAGWYWPFIDYPMYSQVRHEGDRIPVENPVSLIFSDGSETELTEEDLGLNFWHLWHLSIRLKQGHSESAWEVIDAHPRGEVIVRIIVHEYPLILTKEGAAPAPPTIAHSIIVADLQR